MNKTVFSLVFPLVLAASAAAGPVVQTQQAAPPQRVGFDFHSAFLMNLHHFLYDAAVHQDTLATFAWQTPPSAQELATLASAVQFYPTHYASLDLLDDPVMVRIKRGLSVDDERREVRGLDLPPALASVLGDAAPVYAKYLWPLHDKRNRAWIADAKALDSAYGAQVQAGIEGPMEASFPLAPIRTDVVFDSGTRQGAYTDEQIVIPSARADYQQAASLEMLYHEASHTTVTTRLEEAIERRLKATGRRDASDLWHVVQFYTVGAVTRDVLARHGENGYRPYADKRGLYERHWAPYMPVIDTVWREHMAGKVSLQKAVEQMVARLPAR